MRADLLTSVRAIQDAGIEVMAGMIVGVDDDAQLDRPRLRQDPLAAPQPSDVVAVPAG